MITNAKRPVCKPAAVRALVLLGVWSMLASGCNGYFSNREQITFDGAVFRTKAETRNKDDKKSFQATIKPVSASLEGAREAGRWEGTRYCIKNFGSSQIVWEIGPDTEAAGLVIADDALTLLGRCDP